MARAENYPVSYETGMQGTDAEFSTIRIARDDFYDEWD